MKKNSSYKKNHFLLVDENARKIEKKNISAEEPLLINPSVENPARYIEFHEHIAAPKTCRQGVEPKGEHTIELLQLNKRPLLVENRRNVWMQHERYKAILSFAEALLEKGISNPEAIELQKAALSGIAHMEGADGEYSAMFVP